MEPVRNLGRRIHIDCCLSHNFLEELSQLLVHGGVDRVAGTEKHGIQMLILLQMLFVEGQFAIARVRLPEPPDGGETLGPEIGEDMLDPPESVRSRFGAKTYGFGPRPRSRTRHNVA